MNGNDVFIQQIRTAPSILSSAETMAVNSQEPKLQTGSAKPEGNTLAYSCQYPLLLHPMEVLVN